MSANPVVSYEARQWEQDGEQLRDWIPARASDVDGGAITLTHWQELDGTHFAFERADGLVATVTELGIADGVLAFSGTAMRRKLDALDSRAFVSVVHGMGQILGAAIFREYTKGNPFRAVLV